jgi:hypothetical protein
MRTIQFNVNKQTLSLDPSCDISGLVPGTKGYLLANFSFSSEWDGCVKVAAFFSNLGREFEPQVLANGTSCVIPAEALAKSIFKVQVIGQKGDYNLQTNKVIVHQKGGKV